MASWTCANRQQNTAACGGSDGPPRHKSEPYLVDVVCYTPLPLK